MNARTRRWRAATAACLLILNVAGAMGPAAGETVPVPPTGWTGWWATLTFTDAEHCREVTIPSDVLFASDSSVPGAGLEAAVECAATAAASTSGPVRIEGYLDDRGAENLPLSQARADNVAKALIDVGVNGSRVVAMGRGEADPVASNRTASGRAQNRRVEIRIGACDER